VDAGGILGRRNARGGEAKGEQQDDNSHELEAMEFHSAELSDYGFQLFIWPVDGNWGLVSRLVVKLPKLGRIVRSPGRF